MKKIVLVSLVLLVVAACESNDPKFKDGRIVDKDKRITQLKAGDATFLALKDTAQKYLPTFINSLKEHAGDSNYYYLIKSDYVENDMHEHMWSAPISVKDNVFNCIFTDSAYNISNIKTGDKINIRATDVEDWVIYDYTANTKTGSFSEKYLKGEE